MSRLKAFKTLIRAVDPDTGRLKDFEGAPIFADTREEAEEGIRITQPYAQIWSEESSESILNKILNDD